MSRLCARAILKPACKVDEERTNGEELGQLTVLLNFVYQ